MGAFIRPPFRLTNASWFILCPVKFCIMMHMTCKGFYDLSKILDELSLVAYKAKESSYLFGILWWSHKFNGFCIQEKGFYTSCAEDMAQIWNFFCKEVALA